MTAPLDEKGLAAAVDRLDSLTGMKRVPSILTRSGREFLAEKAIRAYLSAVALPDELLEKLRHQHETVGVTPELRAAKEAYDAVLPDELKVVAWEGHWPGAGSINSSTRVTRFRSDMEAWENNGGQIEPLVRRSQAQSALAAMRAERDVAEANTERLLAAVNAAGLVAEQKDFIAAHLERSRPAGRQALSGSEKE